MKIDIDDTERNYLITAMELAIASNKRAQNTSKRPEFTELYRKDETHLQTLRTKLMGAK